MVPAKQTFFLILESPQDPVDRGMRGGDLLQALVPLEMIECVMECLEVVDVEHQRGEVAADAPGAPPAPRHSRSLRSESNYLPGL
jgi:hypothetical protein